MTYSAAAYDTITHALGYGSAYRGKKQKKETIGERDYSLKTELKLHNARIRNNFHVLFRLIFALQLRSLLQQNESKAQRQ